MAWITMTYKIVFHPEAAKDIAILDNRVRLLVLKQIKKLSSAPGLGKILGCKRGMDLSKYRKLYADRKKIRIVYKIENELLQVQVVAVGVRDNMKVYNNSANRTK